LGLLGMNLKKVNLGRTRMSLHPDVLVENHANSCRIRLCRMIRNSTFGA